MYKLMQVLIAMRWTLLIMLMLVGQQVRSMPADTDTLDPEQFLHQHRVSQQEIEQFHLLSKTHFLFLFRKKKYKIFNYI